MADAGLCLGLIVRCGDCTTGSFSLRIDNLPIVLVKLKLERGVFDHLLDLLLIVLCMRCLLGHGLLGLRLRAAN